MSDRGEVLCVATGDEKNLIQWVSAKPGRYVVWVGSSEIAVHPRIYKIDDNELSFQQIVAQLLYLPFVYEDPDHPALQRLARIQTETHYRASDFLDQGIKLLTNYRSNLQNPTKYASDCFEKFTHFPAIVCGAGPSLKEVIPLLKEHRDRFLILGCGAGMQALLSAGIEPHLAVHVDPDPYHKFSQTQVPLFYQLRTSHEVVSQMKGLHFLMAGSGEFLLERWIEEKLGIEPSSDGGWTATTRGVALATALGCKSIYFAGVDFSASSAMYVKGVEASQEGDLIKMTLSDGSVVQTRPDWLLAAEWLSRWTVDHSEHTWGLFAKPNPLLQAIPAAELASCTGPEGVSLCAKEFFSSCKEKSGKEIWSEISASFKKCQTLVDQFLIHFQTIFPKSPTENETCMKILQEIDQQKVVPIILDPIWNHWEVVLRRQPENHPDALGIHRILLLKSLADRFYV
ncbi:MAG: 6-hydroxymethylpterin diphosphokinase MptE-like protein [Rhabdochlamydiaceae bacterium]